MLWTGYLLVLCVSYGVNGVDGVGTTMSSTTQISSYYQEWLNRFGVTPNTSIQVRAANSALIIVDMQNDFVGEFTYTAEEIAAGQSPCHAVLQSNAACFGVSEGDIVAGLIKDMLEAHSFSTVIASMDDHSPEHCSFLASASSASPPTVCSKNFDLNKCDHKTFHECQGTHYEHQQHGNQTVYGPFPPHCVRGYLGTELYAPVKHALLEYTGEKHIGVKGLDLSTDSFGVFRYSEKSWDFYKQSGLLSTVDPRPSVLIRSMLTWEEHMTTSTGAAAYTSPFKDYIQPPPFSSNGSGGELLKAHANDIIDNKGDTLNSIIVSGLAGDWCVLDTVLNAKAQWPDKDVYFVIDAMRPSYLPKAAAAMYLKNDPTNQIYNGSVWLHDPADIALVLKQANIHVIKSDQIV